MQTDVMSSVLSPHWYPEHGGLFISCSSHIKEASGIIMSAHIVGNQRQQKDGFPVHPTHCIEAEIWRVVCRLITWETQDVLLFHNKQTTLVETTQIYKHKFNTFRQMLQSTPRPRPQNSSQAKTPSSKTNTPCCDVHICNFDICHETFNRQHCHTHPEPTFQGVMDCAHADHSVIAPMNDDDYSDMCFVG